MNTCLHGRDGVPAVPNCAPDVRAGEDAGPPERIHPPRLSVAKPARVVAVASALLSAGILAAAAQPSPPVLHLWTNGAPGFENRRDEPELARDYWVRNIHNPSITVFLPPKEKANGAAVLICPGGGHRELVFNAEGVEPARFFNDLGVAAFVLKYRLAREEGSPYSIDREALQDAQRALRLIRSRAPEWNLDPHRIGIMGWSAGGELVDLLVYHPAEGRADAPDPVDRVSCRPDFQILIYPGPLGAPDSVPTNTPPAFMLAANDDTVPSQTIVKLLEEFRKSNVPVEVHLYAQGSHAFNMGNRSKLKSIHDWPNRLANWMADNRILNPAP
ncbi:MAG: alpha/beta hydrolase [Verrucomicrobiota bacterium]